MALKGISRVYLENGLLGNAKYISHKRTLREGTGARAKEVGEEFEIYLDQTGVVTLKVPNGNGANLRPKQFAKINVINPYIVPRPIVTGDMGNRRSRLEYVLWAEGMELVEGAK